MKISWTRIDTFQKCPRSYKYSYVEELEGPKSEALLLGELFHELLEKWYNGEPIDDTLKNYYYLVNSGQVDQPLILLETVLQYYIGHYADEDAKEKIIGNELNIIADWTDDDDVEIIADKLIEVDGRYIKARDHKTSLKAFKHTDDTVKKNGQLYLYKPVIEGTQQVKIDELEIDMIILHLLEDPPLTQKGTPTTDIRKLKWVTYERYVAELENRGLIDDDKYNNILRKLEERGHPLFRRVSTICDEQIGRSCMEDTNSTLEMIKFCTKNEHFPRVYSPLCHWCDFKHLCDLDLLNPCEQDRDLTKDAYNIVPKEERK